MSFGYLTLNKEFALRKAVISFWFRIPKASAERAYNDYLSYPLSNQYVFNGTIPLITFGKQQQATNYGLTQVKVGEHKYFVDPGDILVSDPIYAEQWVTNGTSQLEPSFIGIQCAADLNTGTRSPPGLVVRLQTADAEHVSGNTYAIIAAAEGVGSDRPPCLPGQRWVEYADQSFANEGVPAYFGGGAIFEVDPDKWHHLLLSYDISHSVSAHGIEDGGSTAEGSSSGNKMWLAFDNVNRTEFELPAFWIDGGGPNDIISQTGGSIAGKRYTAHATDPCAFPKDYPQPEYTCDAGSSPGSFPTNPISIPTLPQYNSESGLRKPTYVVEMAELQIFAGVTLDTGIGANRRAFIVEQKDASGSPVTDEDGKQLWIPANPIDAEKLLGRRPDILLHKTSNWKKGKNTGSSGTTRDGDGNETVIPSGQFTVTQKIIKYTPEPSLVEDTTA